MDRNFLTALSPAPVTVALRKESVDRNLDCIKEVLPWAVALRKESVDRNGGLVSVVRFASASLSARRAWIEIAHLPLT